MENHSFSFLGVENYRKETPEKCKYNFLFLSQFVYSSKIDFAPSFKELIKNFEKSSNYLNYFANNMQVNCFYQSTFPLLRYQFFKYLRR